MAWAFATPLQAEEESFANLATMAEKHTCDINAQELANMAWAIATRNKPQHKS